MRKAKIEKGLHKNYYDLRTQRNDCVSFYNENERLKWLTSWFIYAIQARLLFVVTLKMTEVASVEMCLQYKKM